MRIAIPLALSIVLATSMLTLHGCKGDEPAPDVNETQLGQGEQPKQSEQPKQLAQSKQPEQPADTPTAENAAVQAAEAWLKILDSGQYEQAREQAALVFRSAMPQQQWETLLATVRKRMGALVSRQVMSKKYMARIPKAPPGKYVIIQYKSRFQRKTVAAETVTTMLEIDGTWRVAGYNVR